MTQLISDLLITLLATIILEGIAVAVWKRKAEWIIGSILCNIATNPLLNITVITLNSLFHFSVTEWYICVACGEFLVVLTEMWIYYMYTGCSLKKGLVASVILNAVSYFGGLLLSDVLW